MKYVLFRLSTFIEDIVEAMKLPKDAVHEDSPILHTSFNQCRKMPQQQPFTSMEEEENIIFTDNSILV